MNSWPVQSTCKLPPELKARVTNMCSGASISIPVLRFATCEYYYIPVPKILHSRFCGIIYFPGQSGTFGQGMVKNFTLFFDAVSFL